MAYAAVVSLKHTIELHLGSAGLGKILRPKVTSLQRVLKRLDDSRIRTETLNVLDGQIREAVHKLEDLMDMQVSNQFLSQFEGDGDEDSFMHVLEEIMQEVSSFDDMVSEMEEYVRELDNPLPEEDDDANSSSIDFGIKMVGLSDEFAEIKLQVLKRKRPDDFIVFSIVGTAGTGRTYLAKTVFDDIYKGQEQTMDCGAWVTIGPKYQLKEILLSILAEIDEGMAGNHELLSSKGDEEIGEYLYRSLEGQRYMIVLDDVCDKKMWEDLRRSFPEQNNGSIVLLTTGLREIALYANSFYIYGMQTPDEDEMWDILRLGMFHSSTVRPSDRLQFEEAGKKIAMNCQGRLLVLVKVILFLLNGEKTPEYWNKVAAHKENPIFMVDDEISETCKMKEEEQLYDSNDDEISFTIGLVSGLLYSTGQAKVIKMMMFPKRFFPKMEMVSFCGMAGIGKTILVKKIFDDPSTLRHFDHRVWVTLGPKYKKEKIFVDILAQIYPDIDKSHMTPEDLCAKLSCKRCLIVLDDVWGKDGLHYIKSILPDIKGEVLVTTRLAKVAKFKSDRDYKIRLLNEEESWCLLRQKVFAKGCCPPELEKVGRKIAENCDGLPLLILTVAELLSKTEKTPENWKKVAEKQNSIFMVAQDQVAKVLSPSYEHLPQHLKACFLYMGVFPQNFDIPCSKLINLWIAERFLEPNSRQTIEDFATECLSELVDSSLVMVRNKGSKSRIKTCRLHCVFWHLCNREAEKNKFFHDVNSDVDNSIEGIKSQHRLCIRNSIQVGIKDAHNSMPYISTARSLLCTGPYHQYPLPIYLGLRLLRVLDALTIRFYEFPVEVVKLIHLRYLSLTCNGQLPSSISQLQNLHFLIIRPHQSIKSPDDRPYLPMEIWDLQALKHLQIMGSNLPNPQFRNTRSWDTKPTTFWNLLTLKDVSARYCIEDVICRIPKLKKLGIQIELEPHDDKPFYFLSHISRLSKLESLKCVVVNPELKYDFVASAPRYGMFPSGLKKLTLSGIGYPWECMAAIGELDNLEVLKLRCYAFRGPEWETCYSSFKEVKVLSIEDTDLVCWKLKTASFPKLKHLSIKHCYRLEKLPRISHVPNIEVVDCNPKVVTWAKQDREYLQRQFSSESNQVSLATLGLQVHSSWDARNLKQ